jgi:hypothetical protein
MDQTIIVVALLKAFDFKVSRISSFDNFLVVEKDKSEEATALLKWVKVKAEIKENQILLDQLPAEEVEDFLTTVFKQLKDIMDQLEEDLQNL